MLTGTSSVSHFCVILTSMIQREKLKKVFGLDGLCIAKSCNVFLFAVVKLDSFETQD